LPSDASGGIGRLNETALHAALKQWVARPGDEFEAWVDGYLIDVVRGDLLIEIQTSGFAKLKRKLLDLAERRPVRLVHPIARETWIVRQRADGTTARRKSPKRGRIELLFAELASIPRLLHEPNVSLEVVLTQEEDVRRHDAPRRGWRRRGWGTVERRLLAVVEHRLFARPADLGALLPREVAEPFTTAELAEALGLRRRLAQQMAYCLRELGVVAATGKRGNAVLYERQAPRGVAIIGSQPLRRRR